MIQTCTPMTRKSFLLVPSKTSQYLPYWGTPDPYHGMALYSGTLAAYILSEFHYPALPFRFAPPAVRLDYFIAHAIAHTDAPRAAGAAAVVLMRMAAWQPLPTCAISGQHFFLSTLRYVLERYFRWCMPDDAWVAYGMQVASPCQIREMHREMKEVGSILGREKKGLLRRIAHANWGDNITFSRGADARLIVVVESQVADSMESNPGLALHSPDFRLPLLYL